KERVVAKDLVVPVAPAEHVVPLDPVEPQGAAPPTQQLLQPSTSAAPAVLESVVPVVVPEVLVPVVVPAATDDTPTAAAAAAPPPEEEELLLDDDLQQMAGDDDVFVDDSGLRIEDDVIGDTDEMRVDDGGEEEMAETVAAAAFEDTREENMPATPLAPPTPATIPLTPPPPAATASASSDSSLPMSASGEEAMMMGDETMEERGVGEDAVPTEAAAAADDDETPPGSCIVEDVEEEEEERREEQVETASPSKPESDNELGDLIIDEESRPTTPVIPPSTRSSLPTVPPPPTLDTVSQEQQRALPALQKPQPTLPAPAAAKKAAPVDAAAAASTAVTEKPAAAPAAKRGRALKRPLSQSQRESTSSAADEPTASAASVQPVAAAAAAAPTALTLEQKRRALMAGIASIPRGGSATMRGGRGGGARGGGQTGGGVATAKPIASTAGGSRSSAMQTQMNRMAKNLKKGQPAMSGTSRQRSAAPSRVAAGIPCQGAPPTLQPQQPTTSAAPAEAAAAARPVPPVASRSVAPPAKPIGEPRQLKRKLMEGAMDAVAIRAPDPKSRGHPSTALTTISSAAAHSVESRLISAVLAVCKEEETVEKAMQQMDLAKISRDTIVKCVCKALLELPQSNTWHVARSNMTMKRKVERGETGDNVVPKAEKHLFKLLLGMQDSDPSRLVYLFDVFYDEYCRRVYFSLGGNSSTTADVTRSVRILFHALIMSEGSEKDEQARKIFHMILRNKSPQAVCQSLTYLLCQSATAVLASEILMVELDDDVNGGRLMSMHMTNKKDAEVLHWAVEHFAFARCKAHATAAFRTPATVEMVQEWWDSDMEYLERARDNPGAVKVTATGAVMLDDFNKSLSRRMSLLIAPQFRIEGLDRVKLLAQLDTPAIDALDRVTATRIEDTGLDSLFADTSSIAHARLDEGEARVVVLKLHVAIAALTAFYADQMYGADQRDALRLHLVGLIERVHAILERPACKDSGTSSSQESNGLSLGVRAITKWRDTVQRLTKRDLIGPLAESGPTKKRARND
ncbi:hypothetical protein PENTCL1PPCAC_19959, partial [Pristionchus entomophagus]